MPMTVEELKDIMVERFDILESKIVRICDSHSVFGERCRDRHEVIDGRISEIKSDIRDVNTKQNILNVVGSAIAAAFGAAVGWFR